MPLLATFGVLSCMIVGYSYVAGVRARFIVKMPALLSPGLDFGPVKWSSLHHCKMQKAGCSKYLIGLSFIPVDSGDNDEKK